MARRKPGRTILPSPAGDASAVGASAARRYTSSGVTGSPMRARSISPCTTGVARSTCSAVPATVTESPRNEIRTPSVRCSSCRLLSFTPAKSSGSAPSAEMRCEMSSAISGLVATRTSRCNSSRSFAVHRRRGTLEQGALRGGLGKRDDVAERVRVRQQHHDAVQPEGEPAVRRGAGAEPLQQEAEPLLRDLLADAKQPEDPALQCRDRRCGGSPAQLGAVEHES